MSFKLIAIRPLKGCSKKFLKNLEPNRIYKFYDEARFFTADEKIIDIDLIKPDYEEIRNIVLDENRYLPKEFFYDERISVSAVVGKNGSGKSALIELFIATVNQFAYRFKENEWLNTSAKLNFLRGENKICCEVFYKENGVNYRLCVNGNNIFLTEINSGTDIPLEKFFYTTILNYSIHSYNSKEIGVWIDKLFHKNDSYQIPVVLNPKRENAQNGLSGIIDINNEKYLLTQRLISILLKDVNFQISENLKTEILELKLKDSKSFTTNHISEPSLNKKYRNESNKRESFYQVLSDDVGIVFSVANKVELTRFYYGLNSILKNFKEHFNIQNINIGENQYRLDIYILYKIISICEKYGSFEDFIKVTKRKSKLDYERAVIDFGSFIKKFDDSSSHITLKLWQVVNYFRNYDLFWNNVGRRVDIEYLSKTINNLPGKNSQVNFPPPTFEISFRTKSNIDILSSISSGEKQMINSLSSIFYHLTNINSVQKDNSTTKYRNVNIILDEIELYFHPEFQRTFLDRLLKGITKLELHDIYGFNILIITHSPFILSDIPKQNILFLKSEKSVSTLEKFNSDNIFGENIHEILNNGFFLDDSKGEFSKNKIDEFLDFYFDVVNKDDSYINDLKKTYVLNRDSYYKLVNLVGENYIRTILSNHLNQLDSIFGLDDPIILEKQKQIRELENEINIIRTNG